MATTKITSPELFDLGSLNTALKLPSGTTAERPTSPSTGEWRYNTDDNAIEFYDGADWLTIQDEAIPPVPSENFNTVLYDGTSATHAITGLGFQPDLVWIKDRGNAEQHILNDSSRGASNDLSSNTTGAQANRPTGFLSFDSDGFTLGTDGGGVVNDSARGPYVAWCWKANGGTTSSNTDGSITSTVQANTKAGFSIVQWTGTGSAGTLGHGLSSAPELIMVKDTTVAYNWYVFTTATGSNIRFEGLNTDSASTPAASQMTTTSTLIENVPSVASLNTSGSAMIIYAFHSVSGYSKFGSYTGTGLSNGPIINTGFEPAYIMVKGSSNPGSWWIYDNKRSTANPRNKVLRSDSSAAETTNTNYNVDFLSNGFQFTGTDTDINGSGRTYIYLAFAADPSAAPVLADSFNTTLYDGSSTNRNISGLGFSPSFVWDKETSIDRRHDLFDVLRGPLERLATNLTDAENTDADSLTSFNVDGFSLGSASPVNLTGRSYVAWSWKANPISSINTDGSVTTLVTANQAAGFSLVVDSAGGPNTYGHGLSQAPEMIIAKTRLTVGEWYVYHKDLNGGTTPENYFMKLNSVAAETLNTGSPPSIWAGAAPTSTVFSYGSTIGNAIAYCFHSVDGFSKVGSYAGNGSSQTVNLGFEPSWVMLRKRDDNQDWFIFDSTRDTSNPKTLYLEANTANAQATTTSNMNFTSTGLEFTSANFNDSGKNFIYIAFKENPAQPAIPSGEMAYLVVAGGGSGHRSDNNNGAGGGGAGGLRSSYVRTGGGGTVESNITLTAKTYTITVGAGGADNSTPNGPAISGSDSVLDTITSVGGGGGGGISLPAEVSTSGGSGGGGGGYNSAAGAAGTANQGFAGGNGSPSTSGTFSERNGGGGGGAGSVGTTGSTTSAGPGGIGVTVPITGTNVGYAGGGSGGNKAGSNVPGTDGGGSGAGTSAIGTAGTANTGGGGGGGGVASYAGKGGGSGVVILRMNTSDYSGTTTGSPTVTTVGSETILTYTGSGTYVHS